MNYLSINSRGLGDVSKLNWIRGLKSSHGISFLATQETKLGSISNFLAGRLWGRNAFEFDFVGSVGNSGGLLSIWDPSIFHVTRTWKGRNYLITSGTINGSNESLNVVNVYAPNISENRRNLWLELIGHRQTLTGKWIFMGDFNDVRVPEERRNSEFIQSNADSFNEFKEETELLEYNMGGV